MTKLYFDTEFSGLYKNTELISIGIISDDGRAFYGEITDFNKDKIDEWINRNVLANTIEYGNINILDICEREDDYYVGTKSDISGYLRDWLKQFDDVQLVSDVCHYDMALFIDLFGSAWDIPKNVSPVCHDINQDIAKFYYISDREAFDFNREDILLDNDINIEGEKHNALYDAKVIKAISEMISY